MNYENCKHTVILEGVLVDHCQYCDHYYINEKAMSAIGDLLNPFSLHELDQLQHLYDAVLEYKILNGGCSPGFREIKEALNIRSINWIYRKFKLLKEWGLIDYKKGVAKSVQIVGWSLVKDGLDR